MKNHYFEKSSQAKLSNHLDSGGCTISSSILTVQGFLAPVPAEPEELVHRKGPSCLLLFVAAEVTFKQSSFEKSRFQNVIFEKCVDTRLRACPRNMRSLHISCTRRCCCNFRDEVALMIFYRIFRSLAWKSANSVEATISVFRVTP